MFSQLLTILFVATLTKADVDVQVGLNNELRFSPETVTANIGELVTFHFHGDTHSATESTARLRVPCDPLGGFDTGIQRDGATQSIIVSTHNSIYVHCSPHCTKGMVMIVNPGPNDSVETFRAAAEASGGGSSPPPPPPPPPPPASSSPKAPSPAPSSSKASPAQSSPKDAPLSSSPPPPPSPSLTPSTSSPSSQPSTPPILSSSTLPLPSSSILPNSSSSVPVMTTATAGGYRTIVSQKGALFVSCGLAAFLVVVAMLG